jgi:hypothetical protein
MEPAIAAGPKGEIAVAWTSMVNMTFEVKLCRILPGSGPGPIENLSAVDGRGSEQPSLAYGPDGRLHAVWVDNLGGSVRQIFHAARRRQLNEPKPVESASRK